MIKVSTYIQTIGSERFKEFLTLPFSFDQLNRINGNCPALFDNWKAKDMINWVKYSNDDKDMLEVFAETYNMLHRTNVFTLPHPKTINDFINDMNRVGIQLYWTDWIDENYEPKEFLNKNEIKQYYVDLLKKIDKSHELL